MYFIFQCAESFSMCIIVINKHLLFFRKLKIKNGLTCESRIVDRISYPPPEYKQQHHHEPFGPAGRNPGPDPTAARPRRPAEAGGGVFPLQGPARPQPCVEGHRLLAARQPTQVEKVSGLCRTRHQGRKLMEL